jgi:uncharacterized protein
MLRLGPNLDLPDNVVTQKLAFVARSGAGKTYAASKMVEQMLLARVPVVVFDTVGNWYGLRIGADGKSPGLQIPVFGGDNGDVEITSAHGAPIAKLVLERNLSAVIDVSHFSDREFIHFATDFAETLFHLAKKVRSARMIVWEEAQLVAPQNPLPNEHRMLGAVQKLVRIGRNYGIGSTLITQQPQSVSKKVLNQVEVLFVGQLNGAHERKAIDHWVTQKGGDRAWLKDLPTLPVGTMMLWSPQWLKTLRQVQIGKKTTFDASATPELGVVRKTPTPMEIDVKALRLALAASPAPGRTPTVAEKPATAAALARVQAENGELRARVAELEAERERWTQWAQGLETDLQRALAQRPRLPAKMPGKAPGRPRTPARAAGTTVSALPAPEGRERPRAAGDALVKAGARRMLEMMARFHPGGLTRPQVGKAAKVKSSTGTFRQYWSTLNTQRFIEETGRGRFRCSAAGFQFLGSSPPTKLATQDERIEFWKARLKDGERRLLDAVLDANPQGVTRAHAGQVANISETTGTYRQYLSTLRVHQLVLVDGDILRPHPWLLTGSDTQAER